MTLTKRKMQKVFMFRAGSRDVDLLRAAAELQEISQSDFVRQALRKEASRVLAGARSVLAKKSADEVAT